MSSFKKPLKEIPRGGRECMKRDTSDSERTKRKIIEKLRRKKEELGKSPSERDVSSSLVRAARKRFGSWNRAKEEAGLETFGWSKEKIVDKLKELAEDLGRPPAARDNSRLAQAARNHFGSWNDAKRAAGLRVFPAPNGRNWSKERVIQELKRLAGKVGRVPRRADDQNLAGAASRQFGSWNQALEAAGVGSMEPREDSIPIAPSKWEEREQILEETIERVEGVLPPDSISSVKEGATDLLRSIGSAEGRSLRRLALGCIYLSCQLNEVVVFPGELATEALDGEGGGTVERAAKAIQQETGEPPPKPFKLEKVVERFASSAGFEKKALESAVELAEVATGKVNLSGRSKRGLAAAIIYIVGSLHPDCDGVTQVEAGNICGITGVSVRNTLNFLCERLERDDLSFAPCPPRACSGAVKEAFLASGEIAGVEARGGKP
ncbi:hypothetical protein AKJ43_03020 [candidate division MSBL1 archaeon SCGC-AAA261D19]|uniref:Transcription factor TFIIB cyclin-like domain-containing protein n=1 Tax=candidate division MSBL1 archaeon SCGC-AAA261D19 TaxID=1698273 RepID=A0A133V5X9_9EURY|nr:hypothetical protein AKJ43_03020 [candidate division MSBL1 archaeon SCGC-AAA261D19]